MKSLIHALGNILRGQILKGFLLFGAIFVALHWLVPLPILIEVLNVVLISLAAAVSFGYLPLFWAAAQMPRLDAPAWFSTSLFLLSVHVFGMRSLSLLDRTFDINWVLDSIAVPIVIYFGVAACIGQLNTATITQGVVPKRQWFRVGAMIGLAAALTAAFLRVRT